MTAPVVHYSSAHCDRAITADEAEDARAEDPTPPQWWRPMPTSVPTGYRQHCGPCDVSWVSPIDHDDCWNCSPETAGGVA